MAKKPTGLTISKSGSTFTVSWKRTQDYSSQQCQYATSYVGWSGIATGKKETAKAITVWGTTYVAFRVRGKKSGKWSSWVESWYWLAAPYNPSVGIANVEPEKTTFSWNQYADGSIPQDFQYIEYQTAFTSESNSPVWGASATSTATEASIPYTENSSVIASGSHSRWFRARAVGLAGVSSWITSRRVYATPNPAVITKIEPTDDTSGINGYVAWVTSPSTEYPIDSTTVQYLITVPAADVSIPSGSLSWSDIGGYTSTNSKDAISFETGVTLDEDEVMFVRVNTQHNDRINYGEAQILKVGYLADPEDVSLTDIDPTQFRVTVNATNTSDVPDSFLVVTHKTKDEEIDLAIIPHGESSVVVQCPDWTEDQNVSFGVRAVVGTATLTQTRSDGVKIYRVEPKMQSKNTEWKGGTLPVTPANVSVSSTAVKGSVKVNWDWTWSQARYADISWADHEDAWESTSEPSSYRVSTTHAPRWYIAGLEVGKTWYIRVRLVASDGETASPWSPIESIDLSSVPSIPALTLSASVITLDDILSAYWSYVTSDGKAQAYAEICEATISNGVISYGDIIAHTETSQNIDLYPKEIGWAEGETHRLCVRVVSESGKSSDGWSAPVPVTIAEALECEITSTSLVTETIEANSETFEKADIVTFTTTQEEIFTKLTAEINPIQDLSNGPPSPTNICPISGHDAVTVTVVDDVDNPTESETYTISLGTTVYGGMLDVVSGVLTVTHGNIASYNGETLPSTWISDRGVYASGTTPTTGAQVVYQLATPTTTTLTPQQVQTLLGQNNIFSSSGDVEIRIAESVRIVKSLKELPLTVTATGAGVGGTTMFIVERAEDYHIDRPDESELDGHKGETIALMYTLDGGQVNIDVEDLKGRLDDGAKYNLIALIKDTLGQTSEARIDNFEVHWTHQASEPSATVVADQTNLIAQITPIAPEEAAFDDVADIYRLSIDKPELIVEGATFGVTYVDPYPALGDMGGYRIVTRTKNGDYITEDNMIAWVDEPAGIENNDMLNIIDFEGRQIQFYYDTDYSHTWEKDFEETQYLGGSIQGDWNPIVSRAGTISGKAITVLDQEMLKDVRRLAVYPGVCHIRTADGSSYMGDVQVSEDRVHDDQEMLVNYSLTITRVDGEELDGVTLEQYQAGGNE